MGDAALPEVEDPGSSFIKKNMDRFRLLGKGKNHLNLEKVGKNLIFY